MTLSLAAASIIVDKALEKGREMNFAPLTVAVLDAAGQLKALKREDGSSLMRPDIAMGKAYGTLGFGFGGRELKRRAEKMGMFFNALIEMSGGKMVPVPGGVLIRDANGEVIGAVGVTGDISENDEICAVAGIEAAGLVPDTGDPR